MDWLPKTLKQVDYMMVYVLRAELFDVLLSVLGSSFTLTSEFFRDSICNKTVPEDWFIPLFETTMIFPTRNHT
jgi:hypothetical protein